MRPHPNGYQGRKRNRHTVHVYVDMHKMHAAYGGVIRAATTCAPPRSWERDIAGLRRATLSRARRRVLCAATLPNWTRIVDY